MNRETEKFLEQYATALLDAAGYGEFGEDPYDSLYTAKQIERHEITTGLMNYEGDDYVSFG